MRIKAHFLGCFKFAAFGLADRKKFAGKIWNVYCPVYILELLTSVCDTKFASLFSVVEKKTLFHNV